MASHFSKYCVCVLISLVLSASAGASCLEVIYLKMTGISKTGTRANGVFATCAAGAGMLLPPLGMAIGAVTTLNALDDRQHFNEYARVKRLIQGSYKRLGMPIPFLLKGDKEEEEYLRKFQKYHLMVSAQTGLSESQLANIIVKADQQNLFCKLDANNKVEVLKFYQVINRIRDGKLQEELGLELTEQQVQANEELELKKNNPKNKSWNNQSKKGGYVRL